MKNNCIVCGKEYIRSSKSGDAEWENRKYCGHICYWKNKHDIPWNKGKKLPQLQGKNAGQWKGARAKYTAKHMWVQARLGRPKFCSVCHSTEKKKDEWANISREYKRDLDDWIRLCTSCHRKYDKTWLIRDRDYQGRFI